MRDDAVAPFSRECSGAWTTVQGISDLALYYSGDGRKGGVDREEIHLENSDDQSGLESHMQGWKNCNFIDVLSF